MENLTTGETSAEEEAPTLFPVTKLSVSAASPGSTDATANFTVPSTTPQWLSNSSFTVDPSVINSVLSSAQNLKNDAEESGEDEKEEHMEGIKRSTSYRLIESSESDGGEGSGGGRESRHSMSKKKKKKRKKERNDDDERASFDYVYRKSRVRGWATPHTKPSKDYFFDSRGDPDNLAFGSIYRGDISRYKLHDSGEKTNLNIQAYSWKLKWNKFVDDDADINALDSATKSSGRYWSAKYSAIERQKNMKRFRIIAPKKLDKAALDDFIPFTDRSDNALSSQGTVITEESWEDVVLRKTKEFNIMTREHPHNVKVWIDFAEFQDTVASMQHVKGVRLQMLEKKISILEKASELNPEDEDLIIYLLKAYQARDSTDALMPRWEKILMKHSGSCKLWKEFLHVVQGDFSKFKVSELRKMYAYAIQALSAARSKRIRQVHSAIESTYHDSEVIGLELGLVDIFIALCRFEWQVGYYELATALFQAEIEYSLFSPLQLTEQSKQRLFEHFWNNNGARVGEDGALGWSTWLEKEEEYRRKVLNELSSQHDEQGGWTGWYAPESKHKQDIVDSETAADADVSMEKMDEEHEDDDIRIKDDTEALAKALGIDVDVEGGSEVKDSTTWARWAEEESSRDHDQWMPLRAKSNAGISRCDDELMSGDDGEQLARVVLFEDISDYLFSATSEEARVSLVSQFIDFFGGEINQRVCTNSSSWIDKVLSLDALSDPGLHELWKIHDAMEKVGSTMSGLSLKLLLGYPNDNLRRAGMMEFLRNAILLCLTVFPRRYNLEEAALIAEEQTILGNKSPHGTATPCQSLAKCLLKNDRQDILLCGVYARREAAFGNIGHGRKVFDMALSLLSGMPSSLQNAPILCLWYAEMELANSSGTESDSLARTLHILACLGRGIPYFPYKSKPSSMDLLRARQGFIEQIGAAQSAWSRGVISDSSAAFVCSAALFEELTAGWESGVQVLSECLTKVLPERKSQSYELEYVFCCYLRMLKKHHEQAGVSKILQTIQRGLQIYPFNPELLASLVELSHLYITPNKLRQIFDAHFQKKPSVMVWLFALSFEISRGGSQHRVHGLFERALTRDRLCSFVVLWRCYIAYEINVVGNLQAAKRVFFRAVHACPWSKTLWLDGFLKLTSVLTVKELSDLQEVMRDKELNLRTDIYEILLQDEFNHG